MKVYLINQENSNLYKIGISKHVGKRLNENQTGNGNKLRIITSVQSKIAYKVESAIHNFWYLKRKQGEWFELSIEDVNNFEKLCAEIEDNLIYLYEHNTLPK